MKPSKRLEAALEFAAGKHAGQKRMGGEPYISNPMAGMTQGVMSSR